MFRTWTNHIIIIIGNGKNVSMGGSGLTKISWHLSSLKFQYDKVISIYIWQ